jgi:hypothetical protein
MKKILFLVFAAALLHASDWIGVYSRIDKVVFEPGNGEAQAVQIWGVFSMADSTDRNSYGPPTRGYLYLKLDRNADGTRAEWNDFKKLAGSGQVVGFASRGVKPRLRKPGESPANPDLYTAGNPPARLRVDTQYTPARNLLDFKD